MYCTQKICFLTACMYFLILVICIDLFIHIYVCYIHTYLQEIIIFRFFRPKFWLLSLGNFRNYIETKRGNKNLNETNYLKVSNIGCHIICFYHKKKTYKEASYITFSSTTFTCYIPQVFEWS